MSEIIDSLCKATASCDTLVVKVVKTADVVCQPIIKEAETSDYDVWIVGIICATIVLVAIVAVFGFLYWKNMEIKAGQEEREFQKTKEKEECQRKQDANKNNRSNMLEDEERKRKYTIEDEERKRKYAKEDKELERKYAIEDEELKTQKEKTHS